MITTAIVVWLVIGFVFGICVTLEMLGPHDQIDLEQALIMLIISVMISVLGCITPLVMVWDKYRLGNIVIYKKKPK